MTVQISIPVPVLPAQRLNQKHAPVVRPPVPRKLSVRSEAFNMEIWIPAITRQQVNGHKKTINIIINVYTAVIPISMKQTVPAVQLPVPKKPPVPCAAIHMVHWARIV